MLRRRQERRKERLTWLGVFLLVVAAVSLMGLALRLPREEAPEPEYPEIAQDGSGVLPVGVRSEDLEAGWVDVAEDLPVAAAGVSCDVPVVAIIVDDFGYNVPLARRFAALSVPLTWSIIPGLGKSRGVREIANEAGIPYMIHLPMQATPDRKGDKQYKLSWIVEGMSSVDVREAIDRAHHELPEAVALNNHRGSLSTTDERLMTFLMEALDKREMAFIDSRTARNSCAFQVAKKQGIPTLHNSVFLDHMSDQPFMKRQMERLIRQARARKWAVAICHTRPTTVEFLETFKPEQYPGVRFVTVPELLRCTSAREYKKEEKE